MLLLKGKKHKRNNKNHHETRPIIHHKNNETIYQCKNKALGKEISKQSVKARMNA